MAQKFASQNKSARKKIQQQHLFNDLIIACKTNDASRLNVNQVDDTGYPPIFYCIMNDNVTCMEALTTSKFLDLSGIDWFGDTTLHHGIIHGACTCLKALLSMGLCPNIQNAEGNTPLHTAVLYDKVEYVAMLLQSKGISVNPKNKAHITPLVLAVINNKVDICRLLLRGGADPGLLGGIEIEHTPLHLACSLGNLELCKVLLEHISNVEINALRDGRKRTLLQIATIFGHKEIVELLIFKGANIHELDEEGNDALTLSVKHNQPEIIASFLRDLSTANTKQALLIPAILAASQAGKVDCINNLFEIGASPNIKNDEGNTLLHLAVQSGEVAAVDLLLKRCSKTTLTAFNEAGYTPLHLATIHANMGVIHCLAAGGADLEQVTVKERSCPASLAIEFNKDENVFQYFAANAKKSLGVSNALQRTCIHYACLHSVQISIIKTLAEAGVDLNAADVDGNAPLHLASRKSHEDAIVYLLQAGVDIHATTSCGHTALHLAASRPNESIITHLLRYGSVVNSLSNSGRTPIDAAYSARIIENACILIQNGGKFGVILQHQAALTIQSAWRAKKMLRKLTFVSTLTSYEFEHVIKYMLQCQFALIRRYFRQKACYQHHTILQKWIMSDLVDPTAILLTNGPSSGSQQCRQLNLSDDRNITLPSIGKTKAQRQIAHTLDGRKEPSQRNLFNVLKNKLVEQANEMNRLKQENALLKTISRKQEHVLAISHGIDTRLKAPRTPVPTRQQDMFGTPLINQYPPSKHLDLELKRQQEALCKFKQRFHKLKEILQSGKQTRQATATLPLETSQVERAHQKLIRKQLQTALKEVVKMRKNTEALKKILRPNASEKTNTSLTQIIPSGVAGQIGHHRSSFTTNTTLPVLHSVCSDKQHRTRKYSRIAL